MNNKWNRRFLELSEHIATWSKDPSTKVGCVIVDGYERIVSVGFNGYPQRIPDDDLDNREMKYQKVIHAEINAILFAKRDLSDCTLYVNFCPCTQCASAIIQSGIVRVVTQKASKDILDRWEDKMKLTKKMFDQAGVFLDYI